MPGTGWRACSSTTNEFQAASSGRGRAVTMTVSSTSLTTPKRTSEPTTNTRVSVGSLPSTVIVTVCHPGGSDAGSFASMTPPRSATTSCATPSIVTVTWAYPTGTAAKLRHPLRLAKSPVDVRFTGGAMRTRPRTRTHSSVPYPGKPVTEGRRPRARARRSRQAWKRYSRRANQSTLARGERGIPLSLSRRRPPVRGSLALRRGAGVRCAREPSCRCRPGGGRRR